MRITRLFLLIAFMISGNAIAHDGGAWGNGSGQAWKTGFGDCWNASKGIDGGCGDAPAPEPEPSNTIYWYDVDGDGVLDGEDMCPNTPLGVPVNREGCINDNDGDGVPDYLDKCPETPLGKVVDTNGCAIMVLSLEGVHFATNSATLNSSAISILNKAVRKMNDHPSANFTIEGHTDSRASDEYNYDLSLRRASAVKDYLVSQGISASSLNIRGNGESDPVATNETSEGRAANRRVDIISR